jgi:hypothetical protein
MSPFDRMGTRHFSTHSSNKAVDWPVEGLLRRQPAKAQAGDEGDRLVMAVRNWRRATFGRAGSAAAARHIGRSPGLVDEHQAGRIEIELPGKPVAALAQNVRACCPSALMAIEKAPKHRGRETLAAIGDQASLDFQRRHVRPAANEAEHIVAMGLDPTGTTISPRRRRRDLPLGLEARHPAHGAGDANPKSLGRRVARHAPSTTAPQRVHKDPRKAPCPAGPFPATTLLKQIKADSGIPPTIQFARRPLLPITPRWRTARRGIVTSTVFTGQYLRLGKSRFDKVNGLANQSKTARWPIFARRNNDTDINVKRRRARLLELIEHNRLEFFFG